jgi:16S rRNA (cytosine967-C5)-methyltransferase
VLPEENSEQVAAFLSLHKEMRVVPYKEVWERMIGGVAPESADGAQDTLVLTPARHDTDGFFMAVMRKGG